MPLENFTTYTEYDPAGAGAESGHIRWTANHVDFDCYRNEDAFLYDDKGANYFGDYIHYIDAQIIEDVQIDDLNVFYALSNEVEDTKNWRDDNDDHVVLYFQRVAAGYRIYFGVGDGSGQTFDYYQGWSKDTRYYFRIERNGNTFTVDIYSTAELRNAGSGNDGDIDTLTVSDRSPSNFRNVFVCNTYNSGVTNALESDIENLDLQEAPEVNPSAGSIVPTMRTLGIL